MGLKAISCRIEWSSSQVHSTKHAQVIIFIINHKATIVAFLPQRVKLYMQYTRIKLVQNGICIKIYRSETLRNIAGRYADHGELQQIR